MTNIKKIGLTALAGTLATITAHAGEMSVSGTAQMTYLTTKGTTAGETDNNADSFSVNSSLVFSGSGELDNGFGVSVSSNLTGGSQTVANMQLDMGDMGTVSMASGSSYLTGLPAYQDVVPNAGEQVWDDTGATEHGKPAQGIVNPSADNTAKETLGYKVSANGFTLSAHTSFADGNGAESSAVIAMDGLVDGLTIGAGMGNNASSATTDDDLETYFIKYTMGAITVGAQTSKVDAQTAASDVERDAYGISFAVNENLSISYGVSDTEFDASTSDEENAGISASYTAGGATVGLVHNTKDNNGGTAGADHENVELKLTFAF